MSKKKKQQREVEDFVRLIEAEAPDSMSGPDVVRLITSIVLFYATNENSAGAMVMSLARIIKDYYTAQNDGECTCKDCTAERKAAAH